MVLGLEQNIACSHAYLGCQLEHRLNQVIAEPQTAGVGVRNYFTFLVAMEHHIFFLFLFAKGYHLFFLLLFGILLLGKKNE